MKISKKIIPIATLALATAFAGTNSVQAGDFWKSRTAHTLYGLTAGVVIGSHLSGSSHGRHHYSYSHHNSYRHHRPRYRSSVSYRYSSGYNSSCRSYSRPRYSSTYVYRYEPPVRDRVVYQPIVQEPVYVPHRSSDSYYSYKEKKVFPFYKSVDVEVIPPLPPVQPANSQTPSSANYDAVLRGQTQSSQSNSATPNVQIIQNFNGVSPDQVETKVEGGEAEVQKNVPEPQESNPKPAVEEISSFQNVKYIRTPDPMVKSYTGETETYTLPANMQVTTRAVPNNTAVPSKVNYPTSNRVVDVKTVSSKRFSNDV